MDDEIDMDEAAQVCLLNTLQPGGSLVAAGKKKIPDRSRYSFVPLLEDAGACVCVCVCVSISILFYRLFGIGHGQHFAANLLSSSRGRVASDWVSVSLVVLLCAVGCIGVLSSRRALW